MIEHRSLAFTTDSDAYVVDGTWRAETRSGMQPLRVRGGRNSTENAKLIRDKFKCYFNNEGAVEWQEQMIGLNNNNN